VIIETILLAAALLVLILVVIVAEIAIVMRPGKCPQLTRPQYPEEDDDDASV
jgi:hypothetical protein